LGVVTSANAAALRDILRTLAARYPLVSVLLAPALVQGADAPPSLCTALEMLNRWSAEHQRLDAIIVARGGGSIEELWAFNDERVARAIAASKVPVVTGVGHETDFTIADFAADLRAPTPTAAAAACTPDLRQVLLALAGLEDSAQAAIAQRLSRARLAVESLTGRSRRASPERRLASDRQRVDDMARRASLAVMSAVRGDRARLDGLRRQLAALDPARVLERGYAIVTRDQEIIRSVLQVAAGDALTVRVSDGEFETIVQGS